MQQCNKNDCFDIDIKAAIVTFKTFTCLIPCYTSSHLNLAFTICLNTKYEENFNSFPTFLRESRRLQNITKIKKFKKTIFA